MWGAVKDTNAPKGEIYATLLAMDSVLGLGFAEMAEEELAISEDDIRKLIAERDAARADKNYPRADEIRQRLADKGVVLEDTPQGTVWRKG